MLPNNFTENQWIAQYGIYLINVLKKRINSVLIYF